MTPELLAIIIAGLGAAAFAMFMFFEWRGNQPAFADDYYYVEATSVDQGTEWFRFINLQEARALFAKQSEKYDRVKLVHKHGRSYKHVVISMIDKGTSKK